jgi:hypothetical protein
MDDWLHREAMAAVAYASEVGSIYAKKDECFSIGSLFG